MVYVYHQTANYWGVTIGHFIDKIVWILFHPFGEETCGSVCVKPCIDNKSGDESIIAEISVKMNIVTILTSYS